jgi:hypothetical protein
VNKELEEIWKEEFVFHFKALSRPLFGWTQRYYEKIQSKAAFLEYRALQLPVEPPSSAFYALAIPRL